MCVDRNCKKQGERPVIGRWRHHRKPDREGIKSSKSLNTSLTKALVEPMIKPIECRPHLTYSLRQVFVYLGL